jgi:arabinoxylan arabinofuranohydrolase
VNESTVTISPVTLNHEGITQIKNMNPYELQQMETMANSGGIEYEDFTNIIKNVSISTLGNDASRNMQVKMKKGSWINVRKVDFGTTGADKIILRAKGTGTIDIRIGSSPSNPGNTVATLEFTSTDMEDHVIALPADKLELFKGVKNNLYFVVTAAEDVYVDSWQFTEADPSGIQELSNSKRLNSKMYDLSGRRLSGAQQHRGIVIEQYTDENGVRHSRKVLSSKE